MKKLLKVLGYSLLGLLILVILAVVGLSFYLTDDRLRSEVVPRLQEYTGRDVQIEHITYSLFSSFPRFGLIIEGLDVPDPVEERLASVDRLEISLDIIPLISGEVRVRKLDIERPLFTYIVYEDGTTNLDGFLPDEEAPDEEEPTDPMDIDLAKVTITEGMLGMTDLSTETAVILTDLDLVTSLRYTDVIESSIEMTLGGLDLSLDGQQLVSGLALGLSQTSILNLDEETLALEEGQLNIEGLALTLAGSVSEWGTSAPLLDLQIESHSDDFGVLLDLVPDAYQEFIADLDSGGALDLTASLQGRAGGDELPRFEADVSIADGFVQHNAVPERITGIALSARANNDLVVVEALSATAGDAQLSATGELRDPLVDTAAFSFNGTLNADLSTAERYVPLEELGIDSLAGLIEADGQGEGRLSAPEEAQIDVSLQLTEGRLGLVGVSRSVDNIVANVRATNDAINIENLSARSFDNTFTAHGSVNNYLSDSARFDVSVESRLALNELNDYYPVEDELGLVMSGVVDADVRLRGAIDDVEAALADGTITLADVNAASPDLPQPVRDLNGTLALSGEQITVDGLTAHLGESDVALDGTVTRYRGLMVEPGEGEPARFSGQFRSSSFDLDSIIGYEEAPEAADDSAAEPFDAALPNITGDMEVTIGELTFFGMEATNFDGRLEMSPDSLGASRIEMGIFGGTIAGRFLWEIFAPNRTGMSFVGDATRLRVEQLFTQFNMGEHFKLGEYVRANFTSSIDFSTDLDETVSLALETLRMVGDFSMDQTTISDHPIQLGLAEALRASEIRDVALESWAAAFRVEDSVLHMSEVQLTSRDLALNLSGSQNLATGEMNFRSEAILPRQWSERLGGVIPPQGVDVLATEDGRIAIPLTIQGTSDSPRVGIDTAGIQARAENYARSQVQGYRRDAQRQLQGATDELRDAAEERVREAAEEVIDQVEEQAQDAVDEVIDQVEEQVPDDAVEQGRGIINGAGFP